MQTLTLSRACLGIPGLDYASGSFETPYGTVSNHWKRINDRIAMKLVTPPNSTARVILPVGIKSTQLQGKSVSPPPGGVDVGSGVFVFTWAE